MTEIVIQQMWDGVPLTEEQKTELYKKRSYVSKYVARGFWGKITRPGGGHGNTYLETVLKKGDYVYGSHSVRRPGIVIDSLLQETWSLHGWPSNQPCGYKVHYVVKWLPRKGKEDFEIINWHVKDFLSELKNMERKLKEMRKNRKALDEMGEGDVQISSAAV